MSEEKQNIVTAYVNVSTVVGGKQIEKKGVKVLDSKQKAIELKSIDRRKLKIKDEEEKIDVDKEMEL